VPIFFYFNHSVHVNRGISCVECHGPINRMEEALPFPALKHDHFCLDCHRNPTAKVRPPEKITDLNWKWSDDPDEAERLQNLARWRDGADWKVESLQLAPRVHR